MKTYSRKKAGSNKNTDAVFSNIVQHEGVSKDSPENTNVETTSHKRKKATPKSKPGEVKKIKSTTPKQKKSKRAKPNKGITTTQESPLFINDDPLFGDGMKITSKRPQQTKGQRKATTPVSKDTTVKDSNNNDGTPVNIDGKILPEDQMRINDKVNCWLAGSEGVDYGDIETSKETFREAHESGEEKRQLMFPENLLKDLFVKNTVTSKPDKAKGYNFLEEFGKFYQKTDEPARCLSETKDSDKNATKTTEVASATKTHHVGKEADTVSHSDNEICTPASGHITTDMMTAQIPLAPKKYFSSTWRKSLSSMNVDTFPSELSTVRVTESMTRRRQEEKTPHRKTDDYKVPGSPIKSTSSKTQRKGTLHPKNSTQLFTNGFVEVVDAIPEMSTIMSDPNRRNIPVNQKDGVTGIDDTEAIILNTERVRPTGMTSTPNQAKFLEPRFQFGADISSITTDNDDDEDVLIFNQSSRVVCSQEIVPLSTSYIDHQTLIYDDKIENDMRPNDKVSSQTTANPQMNEESVSKSTPKGTGNKLKPDSVKSGKNDSKKKVISKKGKPTTVKKTTRKESSQTMTTSTQEKTPSGPKTVEKTSRKKSPQTMITSCQEKTPSSTEMLFYSAAEIRKKYDIEESVENQRHPKSLKLSRDDFISYMKTKPHDSSWKRFNYLFGNPQRTLSFCNMDDTPLPKGSQQSYTMKSDDEKTGFIPVCPLMYDIKPKSKNVTMLSYVTTDTRTFDEIRRTVPEDDL